MERFLRFARMLGHVKPEQLMARLRFTIRRRLRTRFGAQFRARFEEEPVTDLSLYPELLQPIFPPRDDLVDVDGRSYALTFLNETRQFALPFDWHPPELAYGTRLWKLNLHYMEFLEGLPSDAFQVVVTDWIHHNPPFNEGYWLDNWNSYALSIRTVVWMQQFARHRGKLSSEFSHLIRDSLIRQIRFLVQNLEVDIGGNHLIKNIKALLWAGRFFAIEEAAAWREKGSELLDVQVDRQILPDGMHFERSPAYHSQVFADLLECYVVLEEGALRRKLHQKLSSMAQALVDLTHPDGKISLFNDGGLEMSYAPDVCLSAWGRISGKYPRPRKVVRLDHAGFYGYRTDHSFVLVDCGKVAPDELPAHGHGDILSFEWTIYRRRFVVDAGVFEYNPGARRDYSRSTAAHNTVTIDDEDQCEFWGAFRMGSRANVQLREFEAEDDGFKLIGSHDGYSRLPGRPIHIRRFDVAPTRVAIEDRVEGGRGQKVEARLLLHPECSIKNDNGDIIICRNGLSVRLQTDCKVEARMAHWYPDFGVEFACPQIVLEYGSAPCSGKFLLEVKPE